MKNFTSVNDCLNINDLVQQGIELKANEYLYAQLGKNKTLGLLFFNSSLRTRLSSQKAALNLGMNVIVLNVNSEGWALEFDDGTIMNGSAVEHIKDAAAVMSLYCDIIGVRCFPSLINKVEDDSEKVLNQFLKYSTVPIISLESATLHPLQSLADLMTISEHKKIEQPKIVLSWAPHIKALPQVVANSFAEWVLAFGYNLTITHPAGYNLNEKFTQNATIELDQQKALTDADFVYVKNWSSYNDYGKILNSDQDWLLNNAKMKVTNNAKIMHCLPVRRNLELPDELLDGPNSLILAQAENRIYSAQIVLKCILESI